MKEEEKNDLSNRELERSRDAGGKFFFQNRCGFFYVHLFLQHMGTDRIAVIPHNHPFRLKYQYGAIPDNTMAHTAKGYPHHQCSSGITSKFIP